MASVIQHLSPGCIDSDPILDVPGALLPAPGSDSTSGARAAWSDSPSLLQAIKASSADNELQGLSVPVAEVRHRFKEDSSLPLQTNPAQSTENLFKMELN